MKNFREGPEEFLIKCGFCGHNFNAANIPEYQPGLLKCPQCKHIVDQYGVDHGQEIAKDTLPEPYTKNFLSRII